MTRVASWVVLLLVLAVGLLAVWWFGGYTVCGEHMARYDFGTGACVGGKLLDGRYQPPFDEQLRASLTAVAAWVFVFGYALAAFAFRRFLWSARKAVTAAHEA